MKDSYYNIINKKDKSVEVRLYGEIWSYGEGSSRNLSNKLRELAKSNSNITIRMNSGGGSVLEGVAIYNIISSVDAFITIIIEGIAASAASFICMAADKVVMGKATRMMLHKISGSSWGSAKKLRDDADVMDSWEEDLYKLYAEKTQLSVEEVKSTFFQEGKDVWLSPKQALDYGLVDEIIEQKVKEPSNSVVNSVNQLWQHYDTQISNLINTKNKMNEELLKELSLPTNASQEDVTNAIKALKGKNTPPEEDEEKKEMANKLAAMEKSRIEDLVNSAVKDKRISADQKANWEKLATNDFESAKATLESLKPILKPTDLINQNSVRKIEDRSNWTIEDYLKNDGAALAEMKEKEPAKYQSLVNAAYNNK